MFCPSWVTLLLEYVASLCSRNPTARVIKGADVCFSKRLHKGGMLDSKDVPGNEGGDPG